MTHSFLRLVFLTLAAFFVVGVFMSLVIFWLRRQFAAKKLSFKLVVFVVTLISVVWIVVNAINSFYQERDRHLLKGEYEIERAANRLQSSLRRMRTTVITIAELADEFLKRRNRTPDEIEAWLSSQLLRIIKNVDKAYVNVSLSGKGWYICGNDWIPPAGYVHEDREWYKKIIESDGDTSLLPPHETADLHFLATTYSKLLPDGKTVCCLDMDMIGFRPQLIEAFGDKWCFCFFISPDGTIIDRDYRKHGRISKNKQLLAEIMKHKTDMFHYESDDEDLMVFTNYFDEGWRAVIVQDRSKFFAPVRKVLFENLILACFMFFVTLLFLQRFFKWITLQQEERFSAIEEKLKLQTLLAEEAIRTEKVKSTFLATMSHEIRTPINSIIGFAEFLKDEEITESERSTYIMGIFKSSNALLALINNILDLSKLESGNMKVLGGSCNFLRLSEELHSMFYLLAKKKGVEFSYVLSPTFPKLVALRENRIRQILLNLIGNAVKFTGEGYVKLLIDWTKNEDNDKGKISITVSDSGLGIPKSQFDNLFNPFKQDSGMRGGKVYQSTGLGLPICKKLIESANGSITFKSVVHKGTTFIVTIPDVECLAEEDKSDLCTLESSTGTLNKDDFNNAKILIVDDVPLNLMIASRQFEIIGIEKSKTETFMSASEALNYISEVTEETIIVFTDVWMPTMNGEDLAKAIRDKIANGKIKVKKAVIFAVTADSDAEKTFDVSVFDEVLVKPITSALIAKSLTKALALMKGV